MLRLRGTELAPWGVGLSGGPGRTWRSTTDWPCAIHWTCRRRMGQKKSDPSTREVPARGGGRVAALSRRRQIEMFGVRFGKRKVAPVLCVVALSAVGCATKVTPIVAPPPAEILRTNA